ncbi:MAG: extracellular solute-binding protein [Chloroflexota bacterium]|nr:extracellular solute-binding protein [Chloroflexota bacterium]
MGISWRHSSSAAVAVATLVGVACGGATAPAAVTAAASAGGGKEPPASVLAAAKKEGEVIFYSGKAQGDLQTIANAFTAKYGVKVVFKHAASGANEELAAQQLSAGNVLTDLIMITPDPAWLSKWQGHLTPLTATDIPQLAAVPSAQKTSTFVDGSLNYYGFVYNTKEIKASDLPKDLMSFSKMTKLKGRVGTANPAASNSYATWHAMLYDAWGKDAYDTFIADFIGGLKARLADSSSTLVNLVASGDLAIVGPTNLAQMEPLVAKGAPLAMQYFDPVMALPDGWVILQGAPHPNAAKLFLNWLLSPEGQSIECADRKCASYLSVKGSDQAPAGEKVVTAPVERGIALGKSYIIPLVQRTAGQ